MSLNAEERGHLLEADNASKDEEHLTRQTALYEARKLADLAFPTILISLGSSAPPFLVASYVGRTYGSVYLDAFSLANLTGNLFTLALLQGLFSAADTLSPQAFGAGNQREVGLIAMRGFLASSVLILPINWVLITSMDSIMEHLGIDPEVAHYSWRWYQIYAFGLPFYVLYQVTWKFLSSQSVMGPCVAAVLTSSTVVLPLSLMLWTKPAGFYGTAWAIVSFQVFQGLSLIAYVWLRKPHSPDTWPGLAYWKDALNRKRILTYLALGAGGILASSEWIYWETLSLMIGTLSVEALSIHTIPTNIIMVIFTIPLGLGIALAIRLGSILTRSVSRAKELAFACWVLSIVLFGAIALAVHFLRYHIYRIFTYEEKIIEGAEEIWMHVCLYQFALCMFGTMLGLTTGLGMQFTLGVVTVIALFIWGLPAAYFYAIVRDGGLVAAWSCTWPPYLVIDLILSLAVWRKDWDKIAEAIRLREGVLGAETALTPTGFLDPAYSQNP